MARRPLIFESPLGRLFLVDMGGGIASLCLDQEDGTLSYPLTAEEGAAIGQWFGGKNPNLRGRPVTVDISEAAELWNSDEAARHGNRVEYVAEALGISVSAANYRVGRARAMGLTDRVRANGQTD